MAEKYCCGYGCDDPECKRLTQAERNVIEAAMSWAVSESTQHCMGGRTELAIAVRNLRAERAPNPPAPRYQWRNITAFGADHDEWSASVIDTSIGEGHIIARFITIKRARDYADALNAAESGK